MATKVLRTTQKPFGDTGSVGDYGQFGSLAAGAPNFTKDLSIIQSLSAFSLGWSAATISNNRPSLEDFNGLFILIFSQLRNILQDGIPEWDPATPYFINCFVKIGNQVYCSLQDNNLNQAPATTPAYWSVGMGAQNAGLSSGFIFMWSGTIASIPAGYVFCDGTHGTPDLRDRMIIGARVDDAGAAKTNVTGSLTQTGGSATKDVTHTHNSNIAGTFSALWAQDNGLSHAAGVIPSNGSSPINNATTQGGSATQDVMNPYYALTFIMKS